MNDFKNKFPALYQFFGAYFHEGWTQLYDWRGDMPDYEIVVNQFKNLNPQNTVNQTEKQLENFFPCN